MSSRTRRTSLFSQKVANLTYREKLEEEAEAFVEAFVDKKDSVTTLMERQVPKCTDISQLSAKQQEFLKSLPDIEDYKEKMTEFLAKYSILQMEKEDVQERLKIHCSRLL